MAMTPEEIEKLAKLSSDMGHVMEAINDIRRQIGSLPTREQLVLQSEHIALESRVKTLEARVEEEKKKPHWRDELTKWMVLLTASSAAVGVLLAISKWIVAR